MSDCNDVALASRAKSATVRSRELRDRRCKKMIVRRIRISMAELDGLEQRGYLDGDVTDIEAIETFLSDMLS
jgi:hypothetical protein